MLFADLLSLHLVTFFNVFYSCICIGMNSWYDHGNVLVAPLCFADVCTKGDEDLELGGEEALDSSAGISKRDIHTLNEQRRRDVIKVGYPT